MWRPKDVGEVFAERRFSFKRGGRSRQVRLLVGRPIKGPERDDPWWCPIYLSAPFHKFDAIAGIDSMQCLVLALQLIDNTLPTFARRRGGWAEWLHEHERLIFAGSEESMSRWRALSNLTDAVVSAVNHLESGKPPPRALLLRLRSVVASSGASTALFPRTTSLARLRMATKPLPKAKRSKKMRRRSRQAHSRRDSLASPD
jgi:hypothetical protein